MRNRFAVALVGFVLVFGAAGLSAQDDWSYELTPMFWVAGADGTVTVVGDDGPVRLEYDELSHLTLGGAARFQAQKSKWGYLIDIAPARVPSGDADITLQFYTGGATYLLSDNHARVTLVFGGRYASARAGVRVEVEDPDEDATDDERYERLGSSAGWVDAVVGIQYVRPFGSRWAFEGYADAGVGQGLSFQLSAGVTYQINDKWSATGGYRLIDGNHDKDLFDYDALFAGLYGGLSLSF